MDRAGARLFCDFGFIRSSTDDYQTPDAERDRVVKSFHGFNSYLAIVDAFTIYTWIFPCRLKKPAIELINLFLMKNCIPSGDLVRTNLGGKLACSHAFCNKLAEQNYINEPTGPDAAVQNSVGDFFSFTILPAVCKFCHNIIR